MQLRTDGVGGYVTTRIAAEMLGLSTDAILWRIHKYDVPHLRVGKAILVSLSDLRRAYPNEPPRVLTGATDD